MMTAVKPPAHRCLLVTDFDGTMTRHDFYQLAAPSLLPQGIPDYWSQYRAGQLTHFEALQAIFASIRADLATVRAVVDRMELDSHLSQTLSLLKRSGWEVVITSAGCDWYIRILLDEAGVTLPVWSNPGRFEEGRGLLMELPRGIPYFSPSLGVDKAAVVREGVSSGRRVAFAGDGFPDADAARLVSAELRFARGDLADVLSQEGLEFHRFERWSEIALILCDPLIVGCCCW
jgi:2-hydroxy-3-keto-5-methylthiopentenyl-1-phosphate phosphatase